MKKLLHMWVILFPWALIAGILDYRFQSVTGGLVDRIGLTLHPGAFFDFFSVFTAYEAVLIGLFFVAWIFSKVDRKALGLALAFAGIALGFGLLIQVDTVEPVIKTAWFHGLLLYLLPMLSAGMLAYFFKKNPAVLNRFLNSTASAFALFGGLILLERVTGLLPGTTLDFMGRLVWPYVDPFDITKAESANWLSYLFAPVTLLAVVKARESYKKNQVQMLAWLFLAALAFVIVLLTQSYTGILVLFFLLATAVFVWSSKQQRKRFFIAGVVLAILIAPFLVQTPKFQVLLGNYSKPNSLERRDQIYEVTAALMEENVWKGLGIGAYQSHFRLTQAQVLDEPIPEQEIPPHPHNLFLTWWSDLGVLGLAFGFTIAFWVLKNGLHFLKRGKNQPLLGLALLPAYTLGHGLLDSPYSSEETAAWFCLLVSLSFVIHGLNPAKTYE